MKYLKKHIRYNICAFTLFEMIIAIILSFFVFGIIFLIYSMVNQHLKKDYESPLSNLLLLKSEIEMDFFYSDKIIAENDHLYIFKDNYQINYQFQQEVIIKDSDTLYIGVLHKKLKMIEGKNWITQLDLLIQKDDEKFQLTFRKRYLPNFKLKNKELSFEY